LQNIAKSSDFIVLISKLSLNLSSFPSAFDEVFQGDYLINPEIDYFSRKFFL